MKVTFNTNIDKYKGKFPQDFQIIPRVGEFVQTTKYHQKLPFDSLQVIRVTYEDRENVTVDLHLSELQAKENLAYELGVFE